MSNFTYDALGRLTGYSGTPITTQTYTWDQVANRLTKQVGGGTAVTMTYNDANRPTSDSAGNSYTSDLDGRLTGQVGQTLVWDSLGRLTQVKDPITSANISTYTYDALDRLLTVSNGSGLTKFRYVGTTKQIAQARDLNNTLLYNVATSWAGGARMDFGAGGSNQRYYGVNGHGDLTWTASSTGTVTATLRSDPWGTPGTTSGGSLPSFRFQGSWFDTSAALSWAVTRWYAPALGRFVSEDSLLGKPAAPASRHLFAYGAGDPVGRWDPNGTDWWNSGIWVSYPERTTAWEEFTWSSIFGIALKVSTIACSMAGVVGVFTVNPALAAIGVACSVGGVVGDVLGKRFADSTKEHKWISRKMWYRIDNVNKVYAIRWEYTPYTLFDGVDEDGLPDWIKVKARWPLKIEWRRFNMEHFGWCISSKNVMWYHCDRWGWKTTRFYYPASTGYRTEMDYQAITANQY